MIGAGASDELESGQNVRSSGWHTAKLVFREQGILEKQHPAFGDKSFEALKQANQYDADASKIDVCGRAVQN